MKDFFREYHTHVRSDWLMSGVFALFLSFGIVGLIVSGSSGLQADVSKSQDNRYTADIILHVSGDAGELIFGSDGTEVDIVRATILGDPEKFTSLTSSTPGVQVTSGLPGIYTVQINTQSTTLNPGQVLAHFTIGGKPGIRLTMTDTDFVSGSGVYNLTNQVQ